MERRVALKTLPAAMTKDTQSIQRFQREVKAAAKLTHPNIVAAYDADEAKGTHYFVMEYVAGMDLSAIVKKRGVLKVDVAVDSILQAAKGLEFAHNKGVIHRDIKPANMLLDNEGTIKILDMGLARIEDEAHEIPATQLTQDGSVMGTVDYMAPEQAKDTHTADARSDIYSLGCSLYYLLTGESVYRGSTMVNRIMAHQNDAIPSLTGKHILISQDVDAVFQKMVAKKPEDRFQSMSEVIRAIKACGVLESGSSSSTISSEPSDVALAEFLQNQKMASSPTIAMTAEKPLTDSQTETLTSGFWDNTLGGTTFKPLQKRMQAIGKRGWIIAGGVLASLILIAGIVLKVDTPAGTIILEIDQPDLAGAVVSVDDQQKITIKTGKDKEPIEVVADEKTHTLKVTKGGFETFTKQFIVKAGDQETIKVRLVPSNMGIDNELKMNGDIEHEVAEWVIGMGGMVKIGVKEFTNIKQLPTSPFVIDDISLKDTSVKDDDLKRLTGLKILNRLNLKNTLVSDTGLQYLKDIPLQNIIIMNTQITDEGLGHLTNMPSLRHLNICSTQISNSGVERLKDMKQLEFLNLGTSQIDDLGLGYLAGLTNLKSLTIFSTQTTDSGLKHLKGMEQLVNLGLGNTSITNAGLVYLKDLKSLEKLGLDSTSISDVGLQHLHELKMLEDLNLKQTKVTPQGIASLQKALPKCKIESDFETKPSATKAP
ncbi:MAG: protein kinase [Gimesia sp.]|nr:protein kinase [Gimesia sp.]